MFSVAMALPGPKATVDEFIDNHDGTATLLITCANGHEVRFTTSRKRIDMLDIDGIVAILAKECKNQDR